MLIVTAIFALLLGYPSYKARRQEHSLSTVRRLGGAVFYDNDAPQWANRLLGETWFADVIAVDLAFTEANDGDVEQVGKELRRLGGLPWVRISGTAISDSSARSLRESLSDVTIYYTPEVPRRLEAAREMIPMSWGEKPWSPMANTGQPQGPPSADQPDG